MNSTDDGLTHIHELTLANEIDRACDLFESSWKQGKRPKLGEFLAEFDQSVRSAVFIELVKLDLYYRTAAGETPQLHDYTTQFPEFADALSHLTEGTGRNLVQEQTWRLPQAAEQIAHYQLREPVGQGAFGIVWTAWDSQLERMVAVKLPSLRFVGAKQVSLFLHEARAAAKLNHPNIVRVHDFGEHNQRGYIVFELVSGINLKRWLTLRTPTPDQVAAIAATLADALAHAHRLGVVHRDLKPANVIMDDSGVPHITDFGLAKRMDVESTIAQAGEVMGTLPYMSPEQISGTTRDVDAQADVYSLGAILYQMLAGDLPFNGDRHQLMFQILNDEPRPLRLRNPVVSHDLETICRKSMAKDKSDRYATAADFRDDLQRYLRRDPIQARRISRLERAWRRVVRRPVQSLAVPAIFFLVLGTLAAGYVLSPRPMDDGKWNVDVTTEPPGAIVTITPIDPVTQLPARPTADAMLDVSSLSVSPLRCRLKPGQYQVLASLDSERFAEVIRTVPRAIATPPPPRSYQTWEMVNGNGLEWPVIPIPDTSAMKDLVLIPGAKDVELGVAGSPEVPRCVVHIRSFYVSTHEFSVADFRQLRMWLPHRMRPQNPRPGDPMQVRFDEAMQWAEVSGGRLLTEFELEYLCRLVAAQRSGDLDQISRLTKLTGEERDALVTRLAQIQNVLDGQAEWVWGGYQAYAIAAGLPAPPVPDESQEGPFQILRAGDPHHPQDYAPEAEAAHWDPAQRTVVPYTLATRGCGFRLARTYSPASPLQ